jgi:hypothetical protein
MIEIQLSCISPRMHNFSFYFPVGRNNDIPFVFTQDVFGIKLYLSWSTFLGTVDRSSLSRSER